MKVKQKRTFDVDALLRSVGSGETTAAYQPTHVIFSQGDAADSVMHIQKGAVKLSVLSLLLARYSSHTMEASRSIITS